MDLLHEGGNPGDVPVPDAARAVESGLRTAHPDSVWVILGWQENPRRDLLAAQALLLLYLEDVHQLSFLVGSAGTGSCPAAIRASARALCPRPSGSVTDGEAPGC